ncbi:pentatricopeptide repeat-containing protein [Pyrus ussuriensis x Pyrus communis]|uniref:Pentatricopeptide repeat-containing protein n=1 Tax=Pyrus ussuriensis x Pyrus communis TaxID=2448454 RepID=A0A5N5F0P2_9ROSA|nr:pentatricopeptide repeat-containing protein [Pyrus ussuriensis x Pyrus communis]
MGKLDLGEQVFSMVNKKDVSHFMACSHAGLVQKGKILFDSMVKEHGLYKSVEHYACMVDLPGRANRLDEAAKVIDNMRIEPGAKVWGALLGSSSRRLFELEPRNAGNYVLLADIYAEAKLWDGVPGRSWIEVKRKIYSFISIYEFNPQMEQLHALLAELSAEMKDQGYKPQTKVVLYGLHEEEKERIRVIRISKNLKLCEDCHPVTKFISKFANREILVRDVNRFHHFRDGTACAFFSWWMYIGTKVVPGPLKAGKKACEGPMEILQIFGTCFFFTKCDVMLVRHIHGSTRQFVSTTFNKCLR